MLRTGGFLIIGLALRMVAPATADTLHIVDYLPGTFIDISDGSGTNLNLSGDLSTTITTVIGNAVYPEGDVVVGNNGGLGFDNPPSNLLGPVNEELPSNAAFGGGLSLLGFWDDIGNTWGAVYYREDTRGRLIVQWDDKRFEDDPGEDTITFQIQIFSDVDPLNPIYAQILYLDVEQDRPNGGASATIGHQHGDGVNAVQWSYNTPGAVSNGTVLSVIPEPTTLSLLTLGALTLARRRLL